MKGLILFIAGLMVGTWATAQNRALHLPVIHLPAQVHISTVSVLIGAAVIASVWLMRGKRTGGKP